jgi:hypothetical protein
MTAGDKFSLSSKPVFILIIYWSFLLVLVYKSASIKLVMDLSFRILEKGCIIPLSFLPKLFRLGLIFIIVLRLRERYDSAALT